MPAPKDLLERIQLRLEESFTGIGEKVSDLPAASVMTIWPALRVIVSA